MTEDIKRFVYNLRQRGCAFCFYFKGDLCEHLKKGSHCAGNTEHMAADLIEQQAEAIDNLTAALEASYAVREDERKDRRDLEKAFIEHAHDQIIKKKGPYICRYCVHGGDPYTIDPGKDCPPGCNGVNHWEWGGLPDQNGGAEHD